MRFHVSTVGIVSGSLLALMAAACGGGDPATTTTGGATTGEGGGDPGATSSTTATSTSTGTTSTATATTTTGVGGGGGAGGAEPACGDGNVDPGEECDDGAANADTAACKSDCTEQECGDGFEGPGEECDNGAMNADTAACKADCTDQVCGDGAVGPGESCDDGNAVDGDGCTNACTLPSCGDGVVQAGEGCDDGNMVDADGCTNACTLPKCGDSIVQAGEDCDDGAANANTAACKLDCKNQACGDGFVGPGEACDDGNMVNTDACVGMCVAAKCGDTFVQAGVEACDDGNLTSGDGCNVNCVVSGSPVWTQTFNGPANLDDSASGVAVDPSGNAIVVGTTTVAGPGLNAWVRKYSPDGATLWTQTYNSPTNLADEAFGVATDVAGNIFVIGYETFAAGDEDIWVRRYAPDGTPVWTQALSSAGSASDVGYGIATDPSGNVIVSGQITIANQGTDVWVAKLNPATGNPLWQQTFNAGPNLNDLGYGIAVDAAGDAVVTGGSANGMFFDVWVRKYGGAAGATIWTQTYGSAATNDFGFGVAMDSANNPIVVGTEFGAGQDFNAWTRKYNGNGATVWTQTHNGMANGADSVFGADTDSLNNVIVAGRETVAGQAGNAWVRKYGPAGNVVWTQGYGGAANLDDYAGAVSVDAGGFAVVAGAETVNGQGTNVWVRKYAP